MCLMQQMRRPGWRTAVPSSAPAARPTSSWKPLDGGRHCLGMRSEVRGDVRAGVGGRELLGDKVGSSQIKLGPQVASSHLGSMGFVRCHSAPYFLSLNLPENCLNPLPSPSKAHFLPSFGSLDQRKWDSRSSPARLLSHAPSASPWGGRTDGWTARSRGRGGGEEVEGAACTLLHELLLRLDR